jgi:plastocyanin
MRRALWLLPVLALALVLAALAPTSPLAFRGKSPQDAVPPGQDPPAADPGTPGTVTVGPARPEPVPGGQARRNQEGDHWEQSDPPPEFQPTGTDLGTVEVLLEEHRFSPVEVATSPGTTLRFVNKDNVTHTVTGQLDGGDKLLVDEAIAPGQQVEVQLSSAGTYQFRCRYHEDEGMKGVVTANG